MTTPSTEPLPKRQANYVVLGAETRSLEFKQSLDWNNIESRLELVQTFMAMSNNRDGGAVVIGVRENHDGTYTPQGMEQAHYDSVVPDDVGRTARSSRCPILDLQHFTLVPRPT